MTAMILPEPEPPFVWRSLAAGAALVCEPLELVAPHFFTTRQWELGREGREAREGQEGREIRQGWREIAREIGVASERLRRMTQVHGCQVAWAEASTEPLSADVLLAADATLAIAVQTADCVPLLLADARTGAICAAHAGWRGLAARVPIIAVERLVTDLGSHAGDLVAAVGPSIGACCYEVGRDVRDALAAAGYDEAALERWFLAAPHVSSRNPPLPGRTLLPRPDHWFFDGWAVVRHQLREAGVPDERTFFSGLCTGSHPGAFCSYRRDGAAAGRMAGVIRSGERS